MQKCLDRRLYNVVSYLAIIFASIDPFCRSDLQTGSTKCRIGYGLGDCCSSSGWWPILPSWPNQSDCPEDLPCIWLSNTPFRTTALHPGNTRVTKLTNDFIISLHEQKSSCVWCICKATNLICSKNITYYNTTTFQNFHAWSSHGWRRKKCLEISLCLQARWRCKFRSCVNSRDWFVERWG